MEKYSFEDFKDKFGSKEEPKKEKSYKCEHCGASKKVETGLCPECGRFPAWKQRKIDRENKEKQGIFLNKDGMMVITRNATEEERKAAQEYNAMSPEEKEEMKKKTDEMLAWLKDEWPLIPILLKKREKMTLTDYAYFGDVTKRFSEKFGFNMAETLSFLRQYKENTLKALQSFS